MSFSDDKDLKRYIILDHYEKPHHFLSDEKSLDKSYSSYNNNSPTCIDNITAHVKLSKNKIVDVKYTGIGCAIATSSSDIMGDLLINKSKTEANKIIENYLAMIDNKKFDEKQLGDLRVFDSVNRQPNRINCAKVGIVALRNALNNEK
ncbi:MAG: SUF system NifU family Fe-S cluster assembly protein [Mycoplasmoidaceae bacterium]|nr:SUF system NifU family Fe-S cluster assembly protein [Mycoplasmoidaceae bacterium]